MSTGKRNVQLMWVSSSCLFSQTPLTSSALIVSNRPQWSSLKILSMVKSPRKVGDYPNHPQSPTNGVKNLSSSEVDGSSSAIQENNESKQDNALPSGGHQHSWVLTSPNYSFGFVPPMLGTQLTQFEYQTHDASQLPSFIVHKQLDLTSYYAQFYRIGGDSDGRLSPFSSGGANTKYNGNITLHPAPTCQSTQEHRSQVGKIMNRGMIIGKTVVFFILLFATCRFFFLFIIRLVNTIIVCITVVFTIIV
ncbi:hypothetical protein JHK86_050500 [Glycine max]|nr:hypothetical protein JHK86_050500 [Glycine max]